jgi:hypothetical protein
VAAFDDVLVHAVAGDVTGHDQADRGHVQHRGLVGAGVPGLDGHDRVSLQPESLGRNRLGEHRALRDLAREDPVKQLLAAGAGLPAHHLDRPLGRVDGDAGEAPGQLPGAEPVVAVPVGGVDAGQPPAGPLDPVTGGLDLRAGEGRVRQEGVPRPKISVVDSGNHASRAPPGMRSSPAPAGPPETKTS